MTVTRRHRRPRPGPARARRPRARLPRHAARRVDQVLDRPLDALVDRAAVRPRRRADRARLLGQPPSGIASGEADESPGLLRHLGDDVRPDHRARAGRADVTSEYGTGHDPRDAGRRPRAAARCSPPRRSCSAAPCSSSAPSPRSPATSAATGSSTARASGSRSATTASLRAMFGSGLYLAGLGLFALAVGLLVRHTAAVAVDRPGAGLRRRQHGLRCCPATWGEWMAKLMPGNAGRAWPPGLVQPGRCSARGRASRCSPARSPSCCWWPTWSSAAATPEPPCCAPMHALRPGTVGA